MDDESKIMMARFVSAVEKMGDELNKASSTVSRNEANNIKQNDTNSAHNVNNHSVQMLSQGISSLGNERAGVSLLSSIPGGAPAGAVAGQFFGGAVYQQQHARTYEKMEDYAKAAGEAGILLGKDDMQKLQTFYKTQGETITANMEEVAAKQGLGGERLNRMYYQAQRDALQVLKEGPSESLTMASLAPMVPGVGMLYQGKSMIDYLFDLNRQAQKKEMEGR